MFGDGGGSDDGDDLGPEPPTRASPEPSSSPKSLQLGNFPRVTEEQSFSLAANGSTLPLLADDSAHLSWITQRRRHATVKRQSVHPTLALSKELLEPGEVSGQLIQILESRPAPDPESKQCDRPLGASSARALATPGGSPVSGTAQTAVKTGHEQGQLIQVLASHPAPDPGSKQSDRPLGTSSAKAVVTLGSSPVLRAVPQNGDDSEQSILKRAREQLEERNWLGSEAIFRTVNVICTSPMIKVLELNLPANDAWEGWTLHGTVRLNGSELILLPIRQTKRQHWVLISLDVRRVQATLYDSMLCTEQDIEPIARAIVDNLGLSWKSRGRKFLVDVSTSFLSKPVY